MHKINEFQMHARISDERKMAEDKMIKNLMERMVQTKSTKEHESK